MCRAGSVPAAPAPLTLPQWGWAITSSELASLYRRWCDEQDATQLTDAHVAADLKNAYDAFRAIVNEISPYHYATTRVFQVLASSVGDFSVYDLTQANVTPTLSGTPSVLGTRPNSLGTPVARLAKILVVEVVAGSIGSVGSVTRAVWRLHPATSMDALHGNANAYHFRSQALWFHPGFEQFVRVHYVPQQSIGIGGAVFNPTWTGALTSATAVEIDDFVDWHDLIPLLAYGNYAITDAAANPVLLDRLQSRKAEFMNYLLRDDHSGPQYVQSAARAGDDW